MVSREPAWISVGVVGRGMIASRACSGHDVAAALTNSRRVLVAANYWKLIFVVSYYDPISTITMLLPRKTAYYFAFSCFNFWCRQCGYAILSVLGATSLRVCCIISELLCSSSMR